MQSMNNQTSPKTKYCVSQRNQSISYNINNNYNLKLLGSDSTLYIELAETHINTPALTYILRSAPSKNKIKRLEIGTH